MTAGAYGVSYPRELRRWESSTAGRPLPLRELYRLENCGALRALCRPAFLRSTWRASRVRNPWRLSGTRRSGLTSTSARAIPCRIAPAWPVGPPPWTRTRRPYCPSTSTTLSGAVAIVRACVGLALRQLLAAETRAREHPLDRLAEDLLRPPLELRAQRALLQPARVARMPVVHLLVELLPRHRDLLGIHDDHEVAGVD